MPPQKEDKPKVKVVEVARTTLDIAEAAKIRRKLETRRATGMPTAQDLIEHILETESDEESSSDSQESEYVLKIGKKDKPHDSTQDRKSDDPGSKVNARLRASFETRMKDKLSIARHMVRVAMMQRMKSKDPEDKPCSHKANEWCTCANRFTGFYSTFVDPEQPPYTIWHAGTDYIQMDLPESRDTFPDGKVPVEVFNMTGEDGFCVQISNYGARVTSILMPDSEGFLEEIMPFPPNMEICQSQSDVYYNGLFGRLGTRVFNGNIQCKDVDAQLDLNEDDLNHLNGGGEAGFDRLPWQAAVAGNEMVFTLTLPHGAGGYPGDALLTARYCVRKPNTLSFRLTATCTRPCPFLPVLRLPLNLAGHGSGKMGMMEHTVKINASNYYTTDKKECAPRNRVQPVASTVYDLRIPRKLEYMHPRAPWPGYRAFLLLDGHDDPPPALAVHARVGDDDANDDTPMPFAAKLYHTQSRRAVELRTNQPVLMFETVRTPMPCDPEDVEEQARRDRIEHKRLAREAAAAALEVEKKLIAKVVFPNLMEDDNIMYGEDEDDDDDDDDDGGARKHSSSLQKPIPVVSKLAFAADDTIDLVFEENRRHIFGRGGFIYHRCGFITLQPQMVPLFKGKKRRNGELGPSDVSLHVLRPGQRLLYAATYRFYLEPPMKQLRPRRRKEVQYHGPDERLCDALAKFDMCDIELPRSTPSSSMTTAPSSEVSRVSLEPGDLQADRCSIESLPVDKSRFDRKFLGPPTARVPSPKRRRRSIEETIPGFLDQLVDAAMDHHDAQNILGKLLDSALGKAEQHKAITDLVNSMVKNILKDQMKSDESKPKPILATENALQAMIDAMIPPELVNQLPEEDRRTLMVELNKLADLSPEEQKSALKNLSKNLRKILRDRVSTIKHISADRKQFSDRAQKPIGGENYIPSHEVPLHPSLRILPLTPPQDEPQNTDEQKDDDDEGNEDPFDMFILGNPKFGDVSNL